ncbi:MAG: glycosyltransferase family 39 protein [Oscillospiraceae bacterium]|nr:glycosyltransferase family 39 protein [Oscillospiraceae bacterium]
MLKIEVKLLSNFINNKRRIACVLLFISALVFLALAVLMVEDKLLSLMVTYLALSAALVLLFIKIDVSSVFASAITKKRLIYSFLVSILIGFLLTREVYIVWFSDVVNGGDFPVDVKTVYDAIPLSSSHLNILIWTSLTLCFVIAILFICVVVLTIPDFIKFVSDNLPERSISRKKESNTLTYKIIGFTLLCVMVGVMLSYSNAQSFWGDELNWTIGRVANKSLPEITRQLLEDGYNMPLYYYALRIIYPLVPYGEGYLRSLLSIPFVAIGIIFLYFTAKRLMGERFGFIVLCLASASSGVLMFQCGWQLRPYAFYFCFSAMTMLFYLKRLEKESIGNIIGYAISMILLLYSHWFGAIILVFYGFCDLFLCIKRKVHIKCISSYIIAIAAIIPWFVAVLMHVKFDELHFTFGSPSYAQLLNRFYYLFSDHKHIAVLTAICTILIVPLLIKNLRKAKFNHILIFMLITFFCPFGVILVMFVYSNIASSQSLFASRFYVGLIPHALLLTSFATSFVIDFIKLRTHNFSFIKRMAIFLLIIVAIANSTYRSAINTVIYMWQPYREVADYVIFTESFDDNKTLVILDGNPEFWLEYYFLKRGVSPPSTIAVTSSAADPVLFRSEGKQTPPNTVISYTNILQYDNVCYLRAVYLGSEKDILMLDFLNGNYTKVFEGLESRTILYGK